MKLRARINSIGEEAGMLSICDERFQCQLTGQLVVDKHVNCVKASSCFSDAAEHHP